MAKNSSGKISQIVDIPAIEQQIKQVTDLLSSLNNSIGATAQTVTKLYKETRNAKDMGELSSAAEKASIAKQKLTADEKELQHLEQQRVTLLAKLKAAETANAKEVENNRQLLHKRTQELKHQVQQERLASDSINSMRSKLITLRAQYDALTKQERTSQFGVTLRKNIVSLNKEVLALEQSTGRAQRNVGNYASAFKKFVPNLLSAFGIIVGVRDVINAVQNAISTIKDFEQANANLASILGKSRKEIATLTDDAMELGAITEYTASQITLLQTELAKLGFSEQQILQMTKPISQFATALDADLANAASVAGAALRAFELDAKDTTRVVSVMAAGANKSALDFAYFQTSMSTISPVANAFNFSIEDTVALLGTLANSGFDASSAATTTRNILLNLADANGKLAVALGKPITSLDDLVPALIELRNRGINLSEMFELTDKRSVSAFSTFLSGAENLRELRNELADTNGELERMQKERLDTLEGSTKLLTGAWEGLILTFSESTGILRDVVDWLTKLLNGINLIIKRNEEIRSLESGNIPIGWDADVTTDVQKEIDAYIAAVSKLPEYAAKSMEEIAKEAEYVTTQRLQKLLLEAETTYKAMSDKAALAVKVLNESDGNADVHYLARVESLQKEANTQLAVVKVIQTKLNAAKAYSKELTTVKEKTDDENASAQDALKTEQERAKQVEKKKKDAEELLQVLRSIDSLERKNFIDSRKSIVDDSGQSYEARIKALQNYGQLRIEEIDAQLVYELNAIAKSSDSAKLKDAKVLLATKKANTEKQKVIEESGRLEIKIDNDITNKLIDNAHMRMDAKQTSINSLESQELLELADQYANTSMKQEEYEQKRNDITLKYRLQSYDAEMDMLQNELLALAKTEEEKEAIQQKFRDLRVEREREANDKIIADRELYKETEQSLYSDMYQQLQVMQQEAFNFASQLIDSRFEKQISALEKETKLIDESLSDEIKLIKESADSEEEKERRIAVAEEQAAQRKQVLAAQEAELRRRQAQAQRILNVAQIQIDGAAAIAKIMMTAATLSSNPVTAGLATLAYAQIPIVVSTVAMQTAAVLSTPIPAYAEGGKHTIEGPGIVGDAGKHELIKTAEGKLFITPKTPTLVDIPKNAIIYPDAKKMLENIDAVPQHGSAVSDIEMLTSIMGIKLDNIASKLENSNANIFIDGNANALVNVYKRQINRQNYKRKMLS